MRHWKKEKVKVTYSQVWWPILGICALHLPIQSAHTQHWIHTRSSGQPFMLQRLGSSWGFGGLLKGTLSWYWGWRERCTFTPPIYNSCRPETWTRNLSITSPILQPLDHDLPKSSPRKTQPQTQVGLWVQWSNMYVKSIFTLKKKLWKSSAVECKNL